MIPSRIELAEAAIRLLVKEGALKFGEYKLKSGESSPFFLNLGDINYGPSISHLGILLAESLHINFPHVTFLFGPAYKGIVLATITAEATWSIYAKGLSIGYNRKEEKDHGEGGSLIGADPVGEEVIIVDDVITSGGTKQEVVDLLTQLNSRAEGILVVMDRRLPGSPRNPNLPLVHALFDLDDLIGWLEKNDPLKAGIVRNFVYGENRS